MEIGDKQTEPSLVVTDGRSIKWNSVDSSESMMVFGELRGLGSGEGRQSGLISSCRPKVSFGAEGSLVTRQCPADNSNCEHTDIAADRWPCHRSVAISVRCNQSCIYRQKCSWRWASLSPETCRADSNRSIKRSINKNCCIVLVAHIVVLMMHGLTNVKPTN